jgi:hypothetical protein
MVVLFEGRNCQETWYSCCRPGSALAFISFYALGFLATQEKIIGPLVLVLQSIVCLCDVDFVEVP